MTAARGCSSGLCFIIFGAHRGLNSSIADLSYEHLSLFPQPTLYRYLIPFS